MEDKIYELLLEMKKDIKEIKDTVNRIETTQNDDVMAMLKVVSKNSKALEKDVEYLAGKVGEHEMVLDRLSKN